MSEFKNLPSGWKVVRLGDVFDIQSGSTPSRQNFYYWENTSIYWVKTTDLNNSFISDTEEKISEIGLKESSCKVYPKNTILIAMYGGFNQIGRTGILKVEAATNQAISALLPSTKANSLFVNNILICHRNKWKNIAISSRKDPNITKRDIENFKIPLPPLNEQKKIAKILSTWDEAINLTINLIESKKQFKKALMQNLLTAKIRFPQFKDEWEETKLGNIGVFKTSSVDKIIQKDECIVNLVNYMDVYRNKHINSNLKLSQTSASNREIENLSLAKGDVLFTPSSETPDDIGHSAVILSDMPNTLFSYHLVRFRLDIKNDIVFLGYVFNQDKILKQFARLSQGITRYTLSISDFQNVFINFPNLNEQQKIAEVLTACDDEINLLNLKLENLKKQKQGLMQKLLIGETRTCYVKKAM